MLSGEFLAVEHLGGRLVINGVSLNVILGRQFLERHLKIVVLVLLTIIDIVVGNLGRRNRGIGNVLAVENLGSVGGRLLAASNS